MADRGIAELASGALLVDPRHDGREGDLGNPQLAELRQEVPAPAAAVVVRVAVDQALQELLDQRPAQRRRSRLFDADLAAGDPALDLLDEPLGKGLGRLVRRAVPPLPVLTQPTYQFGLSFVPRLKTVPMAVAPPLPTDLLQDCDGATEPRNPRCSSSRYSLCFWRSGRNLKTRAAPAHDAGGRTLQVVPDVTVASTGAGPPGAPAACGEPATDAADPVAAELEAVLAMRQAGADAKTLRRALRRIEELLDE